MKQLTLRVDDELVRDLKAAAAKRGESVNAYAQAILGAAVNPDLADDETARLRARLARAGLLEEAQPARRPPPSEAEFAEARTAAGRGRPLSEFVSEGRR